MKIPGLTILFMKSIAAGEEYRDYCTLINRFVYAKAVQEGVRTTSPNFSGDIYIYRDEAFKLTYKDSDYGNDHYMVEVSTNIWNDLPSGVNPDMVHGNSGYNYVYDFQDGREVLCTHIPGTWANILTGSDELPDTYSAESEASIQHVMSEPCTEQYVVHNACHVEESSSDNHHVKTAQSGWCIILITTLIAFAFVGAVYLIGTNIPAKPIGGDHIQLAEYYSKMAGITAMVIGSCAIIIGLISKAFSRIRK